ncbi:MAG: HEAT repeat domain-containing protein [Thermodesulfobacteriota bacterium]
MAEQHNELKSDTPSASEEIHDAEQIVARLILAAKNLNLYPDHHAIARQSIEDLYNRLRDFTARYGEFAIEIFKTRIEYRGHNMLPGTAAKENLAYLCYRDGLQWLTFSEDISPAELKSFLEIVNSHQVMEAEGQSDIVTDLWEAGLFHIRYATNNRIWENEPLLDIASLKVDRADDSAEGATGAVGQTPSICDLDSQLWQLQPEEIEKTRRMVAREENRDFNQDVFDVLLVILHEQRAKEDFSVVLEIIHGCFVDAVSRGQFHRVCNFLKEFYSIRDTYKADGHWALAYLDDFLRMISGPRGLAGLKDKLMTIGSGHGEQVGYLKQMLVLLSPESILFLGPMLPALSADPVRRALSEAICDLAARDMRPLAHLVRNSDQAVATSAIGILSEIPFQEALPLLLESGRSPNDTIRKSTVSALIKHETTAVYHHLLPFFSDGNRKIRHMVFQFFSRRRRPEAEDVLVERLQADELTRRQGALLFRLYCALGSCGSNRSLAFLKNRLFARPWRIGKLCALHRTGAAMAMRRLDSPDADALMARASKSLWPTVRRALKRAGEDAHAP